MCLNIIDFFEAQKQSIMDTQFVTDNDGNKIAVIIPINQYQKMIEQLEDSEDAQLYKEAMEGDLDFIDAEKAFQELDKKREQANV